VSSIARSAHHNRMIKGRFVRLGETTRP
jgi:hypothetical protein